MISSFCLSKYAIRRLALLLILSVFVAFGVFASISVAQEVDGKSTEKQKPVPHVKEEISLANVKVDVKPVARDEEIRQRLASVLKATEWFTDSKVRVEQGVVFLSGERSGGN